MIARKGHADAGNSDGGGAKVVWFEAVPLISSVQFASVRWMVGGRCRREPYEPVSNIFWCLFSHGRYAVSSCEFRQLKVTLFHIH